MATVAVGPQLVLLDRATSNKLTARLIKLPYYLVQIVHIPQYIRGISGDREPYPGST